MKRLFVGFLLVTGWTVHAGLMQPLPIEALATNAEVIVHGKVASKTVQRDPEGRIYTRVTLEITEVWKGTVKPEEFSIVYSGGRLGDKETRVSIPVNYEVGEEVVAMLRLNQRKEGVTLAAVQGKFSVAQDQASGRKFVSNVFHGRSTVEEHAGATTTGSATKIPIEELKRQVKGGKAE